MRPQKKCFVLMPFRQPYDTYYTEIFKPALESAGYTVQRADDVFTPGPIMIDIQESIANADLILCVMNERSPNVFYELGLAHAVGKPAILVSESNEDIPFDLRHLRVILYDPKYPGWDRKLCTHISRAAASITRSSDVWPPPMVAGTSGILSEQADESETRADSRVVDRPVNLSFDGPLSVDMPLGWFDSYGLVNDVSTSYRTRVIQRPKSAVRGACALFHDDGAKDEEFGSLMQRCRGTFVAGKTIRIEAELRTESLTKWAGIWLRADGEETPDIFFDNMQRRPIRGSTPWTVYRIDAPLPQETVWLNYGVLLVGRGTVWADDFRLFVWSTDGRWEEL